MKHKKISIINFIFAIIFSTQCSCAITIDGNEVDFNGEERISVTCQVDSPSNITYEIKDNGIETGFFSDPNIIQAWNGIYSEALQNNKKYKGCTFISQTHINIEAGTDSTDICVVMKAETDIKITTGNNMLMQQTVYEAQGDIVLSATRVHLKSAFARTPRTVKILAPNDSGSWLEAISFSATDTQQRLYSLGIDGVLNFKDLSETYDENMFLVVGTNAITFHLRNLN